MTSTSSKGTFNELERDGGIPLYRQLEQQLRSMVEDGTLAYGQMLPSEMEMIENYQVSRTTIRQAIRELEAAGLVRREQGKGTFVCRAKLEHPLYSASSFTKDILNKGGVPGGITLFAEQIIPGKTLGMELRLKTGETVIKLERLRTVDGEPVGIHTTHLVSHLAKGLDLSRLLEDNFSLYTQSGAPDLPSASVGRSAQIYHNLPAASPDQYRHPREYILHGGWPRSEFRCQQNI